MSHTLNPNFISQFFDCYRRLREIFIIEWFESFQNHLGLVLLTFLLIFSYCSHSNEHGKLIITIFHTLFWTLMVWKWHQQVWVSTKYMKYLPVFFDNSFFMVNTLCLTSLTVVGLQSRLRDRSLLFAIFSKSAERWAASYSYTKC